MDDFGNKISVGSICSTETTFTDHVVLQEALDHIRKGTLNKIPEGRPAAQFRKSTVGMINDAKAEGMEMLK